MKLGERVRGVTLALQSVKVTPSVYLMGLSDSEQDKPKNLQLLERDWFDIALVYSNRRRAIHRLGKGRCRRTRVQASFFDLGTERAARVSSTSITARTIRPDGRDHDDRSLPLGCSTHGTRAAPQ
jgi:hypothetical protein